MTASATALATSPSCAVASGDAASGADRVDPGLQLDPVGVGEPGPPVGRHSRSTVPGRASVIILAGSVSASVPGLADHLAPDVVAVARVEEDLDGAQHAVGGAQQDQLRVLEPVGLRRSARGVPARPR